MNLNDIAFPVFYVGKEPMQEGNISYFVFKTKNLEDDVYKVKVLDDKSIDANTLAKRRLLLSNNGVDLYDLKYAIYFIGDLIKITKGTTWFIDSSGKIFNYKKSKRCKLVFKKLKNKLNYNGTNLLEVEGYSNRFKVLYEPEPNKTWAAILLTPTGPVLYGLYDKQYKDTARYI